MASIPLPGPRAPTRLRDRFDALCASPRVRQGAIAAALIALALLFGAAVAYAAVGATLLALAFVACLLCLRDFRVGVMLLIVIMPISTSTLFPRAMFGITGLNPLNVLLVATLGVFLMRAIGTGNLRGFMPRPLWWLYIVPIAVGGIIGMAHVHEIPRIFKALGILVFDAPAGYWRDLFFKPMTLVVYAALVGAAVAWSKKPERFVIPMLVSVFVMALMSIIFIATSGMSLSALAGTYARHFLSTIGMHANDLGRLYAVSFALMLFVWDRTGNMALKTVLVFGMGIVAIALLLTFSRGAFFGFVVVCVLYFALRRSLKTVLILVTLVPPALLLVPGAFLYRLQVGLDQGLNEVTAGRFDEIWMPLLPEILSTPPWGNGLGSILWSRAMRMEEIFLVAHPHNAYFQIYMDLGIIGAVLVLAFWIHSLVGFWKLSGDERLVPEMQGFFEGAAVGLVSFFVAAIAGSSFLPVPEQSYLWLALGLMWGVRRHLARGTVAAPAGVPNSGPAAVPTPGPAAVPNPGG